MLWLLVSEILLCSNKDNGGPLPLVVSSQFGHPLRLDVVEGSLVDETEADQEHVGVRVGERPH